MGKYILEGYHHRVFGAVASLKGQFEGPEWRRLQEMHKYEALSGPEREKAMASAIGPLPAAADVQAPRAEDSNALLRADALRWLAYRTSRLGGDEDKAVRDLIRFWAVEFNKSVESLDFPAKWRNTTAGKLFREIKAISEDMIRPQERDYPEATFANGMKIWLKLFDMHEAMDSLLVKAVGGAPRPMLTT